MRRSLSDLKAGEAFGRYELLLPVAQGGMSRVWAARLRGTRGFEKLVAIKTLHTEGPEKHKLEPMLLAEARLAAQIQHPNVAQYLDLGEREGVLFVVMEWVEGEPLTSILKSSARKAGLPLSVSAQIVAQACNGLHAAHELRDARGEALGLVHCDVSPHNLMVGTAGAVKLIDFGIAKAIRGAPMGEVDGLVAGKLAFMAPEQALGDKVDRRADIFSLGIVLYLLTTGRHPFGFGTPAETLQRILGNAPVIPPCAAEPRYPRALERIVMRALAHDRAARFDSAAEMAYELSSSCELAHETEVGAFLQEVCGDSVAERRRRIQKALELATPPDSSQEDEPLLVSIPRDPSALVESAALAHASTTAPSASDVLRLEEKRPWRRALSWAAVLLVASGALGFFGARARQAHPATPPVSAATISAGQRPEAFRTAAPSTTPLLAAPAVTATPLPVTEPMDERPAVASRRVAPALMPSTAAAKPRVKSGRHAAKRCQGGQCGGQASAASSARAAPSPTPASKGAGTNEAKIVEHYGI